MHIYYNAERIKRSMKHMTRLTGISLAFMNTERKYLCHCCPKDNFCAAIQKDPKKEKNCWNSDYRLLDACESSLQTESHLCHAGLFDAVVPVIKSGVLVGYFVPGRIRIPNSTLPESFRSDPHLTALWNELPCYTPEQIESLKALLPNILSEDAIVIKHGDLASEMVNYMKEHLAEKMDLDFLCKAFFISKNTLYRIFRNHYNTTAQQYLTDLRMERAKRLLTETEMTIAEVATAVGIEDYHYFCRVFTRRTGTSPGAFRRDARAGRRAP